MLLLKRRPVLILVVPIALTVVAFLLHTQTDATAWVSKAAANRFQYGDADSSRTDDLDHPDTAAGGASDSSDWGDADTDDHIHTFIGGPETGGDHNNAVVGGVVPEEGSQPPVTTLGAGAVATNAIESYMRDYLLSRAEGFDAKVHLDKYGLKLGVVNLEAYHRELLEVYNEFFGVNEETGDVYSFLAPVLSRLSLRPPTAPLPPLVKQVAATEKNLDKIPSYFDDWDRIMPNWNITLFDDTSLEQWVNYEFGGSELERLFNRLPRQVLKSDLFRYLFLLVEGGIYTDSDTAPVIPAERWGQPYEDRTPEILEHLSRLLMLSDDPQADVFNHPVLEEGGELGEPALVVGIEFDSIMYGWDWTKIGVSRAVQITQWTMMARPGHPVFLDVVGRALHKTIQIEEERRKAEEEGREYVDEWALEWTGPGVWTDCVYRYLLARYGFTPEMLIRVDRPIRVGDVLILPSKTFAASERKEVSEKNKPFTAIFHGFNGRWRGEDPTVKKINELKKIEKEKEEKEKKEKEEKEKQEKEKAAAEVAAAAAQAQAELDEKAAAERMANEEKERQRLEAERKAAEQKLADKDDAATR